MASSHAAPRKAMQRATVTRELGAGSWVTGECGHTWWAYDVGAAIHYHAAGRLCPDCGQQVQVRQGRGRVVVCAIGGCGTRLSIYNRSPVCSAHTEAFRVTHRRDVQPG